MQAYLRLPLAPPIRSLFHEAQLGTEIIRQAIAHTEICTISIKDFDASVLTDVSLAIQKNLIVQCDVHHILGE